jgi:hypothetical protein
MVYVALVSGGGGNEGDAAGGNAAEEQLTLGNDSRLLAGCYQQLSRGGGGVRAPMLGMEWTCTSLEKVIGAVLLRRRCR